MLGYLIQIFKIKILTNNLPQLNHIFSKTEHVFFAVLRVKDTIHLSLRVLRGLLKVPLKVKTMFNIFLETV